MSKKLKQALCMISALVVMCISFVVPASADGQPLVSDGTDLSAFDWSVISQRKNIEIYGNKYFNKSDNFIILAYVNNDKENCHDYLVLNLYDNSTTSIDYTNDFRFFFGQLKFNNDFTVNPQNYGDRNQSLSSFLGAWSNKSIWKIIFSTVKITGLTDKPVIPSDPSAIPAPYTVTYSPELKLGLTRKTSEYESKSIDITLTLNKDYLDWYIRRKSEWVLDQSCGKFEQYDIKTCLDTAGANIDIIDCAKSKAIYFISLSDTSKSLKTVTGNSVYTYLTEQRYSIVDKQSGKIDGSTSTATYANGLYPYFTINFNDQYKKASFYDNLTYSNYQSVCSNLPSYTFSIPLENINAEKFETISALNSILTCEYTFDYDKMFENSSQSTFSKSYKEKYNVDRGPKGVSFTNDDNWNDDTTGYADYFSKSDCYTVYSEKFSFDSYPDYVPIKDNDGNEIDNIKHNPFDLALNPVKPNSYQSVDKGGNLSEKRTEDEQIKYDKDFKYSHNFANVDYTDFSSIFSTSSSYFEFLTASIRILPDWFIATFTAWFITFLTLALIKYVIQ